MAVPVFGRMEMMIDGKPAWATGDFTINPGVGKREPMMTTDGRLAGLSEEPQVPSVSGKVLYAGDVSLSDLTGITQREIQIVMGTHRLVFRNAVFTGTGEIDARSGEIDVAFHAESMEEVA